jgi:DNA-binding NtrC family response regulator
VASRKILIADDDPDMRALMEAALKESGFEVTACPSAEAALAELPRDDYDVVVADFQMPGMNGLELCERIVAGHPDVPVVVVTAHGTVDTAIGAIRAGAYDFVLKPIKLQPFQLVIERAARHRELSGEVRRLRETRRPELFAGIIGESRAIRDVLDLVERVAPTDSTVLVTGESGTGKELIARAIHQRSRWASGPFVAINCSAVPETLFESELFGHAKGAFTDAKGARAGLFLQASGGTIFLDEIGEMPYSVQAKLLRVLQERRLRPVGADHEVPFDARVVAATNRDLEAAVEEGRFRQDLLWRVQVVRIEVPPLRERTSDILLLAQHALERFARAANKEVKGISAAAAQKLLAYGWPGNVRELHNVIERAVALTRYAELTVEDLPERVRDYRSSQFIVGSGAAAADGGGRAAVRAARARFRAAEQSAGGEDPGVRSQDALPQAQAVRSGHRRQVTDPGGSGLRDASFFTTEDTKDTKIRS